MKLNDVGEPQLDIERSMKQPETIKVTWEMPDGARCGGRTRDVSANIVPDKGVFGPEYALQFTYLWTLTRKSQPVSMI